MCKLCLPGPRKGREKGASEGGRKAKGRWGQSIFVMARVANENKESLLAFLAVGRRWFWVCVSMVNRLLSLKQCLGFDALRELRGLCELRVAEVSRSLHSFCFCFCVRAIDLNRYLMHLDVQAVSSRPQKRPRKRSQPRRKKSQRQMGSKHVGNDQNGSLRFWLWVAGGFIHVSDFSLNNSLSLSLWNKDFGFDA